MCVCVLMAAVQQAELEAAKEKAREAKEKEKQSSKDSKDGKRVGVAGRLASKEEKEKEAKEQSSKDKEKDRDKDKQLDGEDGDEEGQRGQDSQAAADSLLQSFWDGAADTLISELESTAAGSSFIKSVFVNEFPRLSALFHSLFLRLHATCLSAANTPLLGLVTADWRVLIG